MSIFLSVFDKVNETRWIPRSAHFMPFHEEHGLHKTKVELAGMGVLVEDISEDNVHMDCFRELVYNPKTGQAWYEYTPNEVPKPSEEQDPTAEPNK